MLGWVFFSPGKATYLKLIMFEMHSANRCPNNGWTCVSSPETREAGGCICPVCHTEGREGRNKNMFFLNITRECIVVLCEKTCIFPNI